MSTRCVDWAFRTEARLGSKVVLLAIAHAADHDGRALLSTRDLSEMAGMTRDVARQCLRRLEKMGLVETTHRKARDGGSAPSSFQLMMGDRK